MATGRHRLGHRSPAGIGSYPDPQEVPMRRLLLVAIAAAMISMIPKSAHAELCIWYAPDEAYAQYDQVFTGMVLENQRPHRPVLFVDTILKGRQIEDGTTVIVRIDGWWPQHLNRGTRYTIPAFSEWVPSGGQKIYTTTCAPITDPIVNPAAYGLSVMDSVL